MLNNRGDDPNSGRGMGNRYNQQDELEAKARRNYCKTDRINHLCEICGKPRIQRVHTKCSKILQQRYFEESKNAK